MTCAPLRTRRIRAALFLCRKKSAVSKKDFISYFGRFRYNAAKAGTHCLKRDAGVYTKRRIYRLKFVDFFIFLSRLDKNAQNVEKFSMHKKEHAV